MKGKKAVLFDMDGVLFDSMPAHAKCWVEACRKFGLRATERDTYMNEGRTGASTIDLFTRQQWGRAVRPEEVEAIYAEKCRLFNRWPEAPKMPGAEAVLRKVQAAGLTIAVVTGSGQASLLERLEKHYSGFFRPGLIVSSRDCERGKPFPDPYLLGLRRAGVSAEEAVVVENAPLGVEAAKAAGIFTVAVNTGPLPDRALLDAGADRLYPSMQAFADGWEALFGGLISFDEYGEPAFDFDLRLSR
ncbi:MAG: HAD-IA family hydrolase [Alloprevotella sp.]|nr:HAD-IA family hydrolase [Alloprevotella sp.]